MNMKSADRDIVTVVPGEHRWLRALYAANERARLPVSDAILADRSSRELGISAHSPLSSTHASMPPCLVAGETRQRGRHFYRIASGETGYEDFSRPYVKAKTCSACSETERCLGVPRPYAETFGLAELEPLGGS